MEITTELLADLKAKARATGPDWKIGHAKGDWIGCKQFDCSAVFSDYDNALFASAASPDVVLALITEIESLRSRENAQKWACGECQEVEQELKQKVERLHEENTRLKVELHDLDSSGGEMAKDYRQLEKEADWLAEQLLACTDDNRIDTCRYTECGLCSDIDTVAGWRKSARKAVEAKSDLFDRLAEHPDTKLAPEEE